MGLRKGAPKKRQQRLEAERRVVKRMNESAGTKVMEAEIRKKVESSPWRAKFSLIIPENDSGS